MSTDANALQTSGTPPPLQTGSVGGAGSPCPSCGFLNAAGMRFCGNCGAALIAVATLPSPPIAVTPPPAPALDAGVVAAPPTTPEIAPSNTVVTPSSPPRPAFAIPADAFARERERDRLLTLSNVQRMRGQIEGAQITLENVLALMEGASNRDLAPVYEQMGDLLTSQSKWEQAQAAFGKAHELDPARASSEKKFAQMTLRVADEKALAKLGVSGGAGLDALAPLEPIAPRKPGLALISSLLLPGLGQFYNGETNKGIICLGIYAASLILARLLPDSTRLMEKFTYTIANRPTPGGAVSISPLLWLLLAISFAVWAYSVVDAAMGAGKTGGATSRPTVDKTGWEV